MIAQDLMNMVLKIRLDLDLRSDKSHWNRYVANVKILLISKFGNPGLNVHTFAVVSFLVHFLTFNKMTGHTDYLKDAKLLN